MKNFIIGFYSNFTNELTLHKVGDTNIIYALKTFMMNQGFSMDDDDWDEIYSNDIEGLKHYAFDCDHSINIMELE